MSRRPPVLTFQGWLLAILLPSLGLLIVAFAVSVYFRLERLIMAGFDSKMTAVATTTAAFIDPADHQRLIEPLPLGSLTHDPVAGALWGLDSSKHQLLRIRTADGFVEETGIPVPEEATALTNGINPGELYLIDEQTGRFSRFFPATGRIAPAFRLDPPIFSSTTDILGRRIYVAGRTLRRVDLDTGNVAVAGTLAERPRDLTWDRSRRTLWGLNAGGTELLEIDPATGAIRSRRRLFLEKSDPADPAAPQPAKLQTLVYDPATERLLGTADSLARIDRATGAVSVQGYLPSFGQEQGPIYARYARPMTRIMARANLTYLYTQIVLGQDHIIYGLDGTVGKDHSPLLSTDIVRSAEVAGIQRLLTDGTTYVSDIESWPPWGLLKSAFAPIFDDDGRVVAMAGADVNAGTIEFQTRRALVVTFGFGAALLALGGALTFVLSRRITDPLNTIKIAALHAAGGDYSQRVRIERPREMRHLAERFTAASAALGREMGALRENLSVRQAERDRLALVERLERLPPLAPAAAPEAPWAWGELGPRRAGGIGAGGAVQAADRALAWISLPAGDALEEASRRAEIAATAAALLARRGSDAAALGPDLQELFRDEIAAWALLTPGGVHCVLRGSGRLLRLSPDGRREAIAPPDFAAPLRPGRGEALILAGPDAAPDRLPAGASLLPAAGLLAAWRSRSAENGPSAFAVVATASTP